MIEFFRRLFTRGNRKPAHVPTRELRFYVDPSPRVTRDLLATQGESLRPQPRRASASYAPRRRSAGYSSYSGSDAAVHAATTAAIAGSVAASSAASSAACSAGTSACF